MEVEVLYFQSLRKLTGINNETYVLGDGATLGELVAEIQSRHPKIGNLGASLLFAVNEEHVGRDRVLADGDKVALMPPFSGG